MTKTFDFEFHASTGYIYLACTEQSSFIKENIHRFVFDFWDLSDDKYEEISRLINSSPLSKQTIFKTILTYCEIKEKEYWKNLGCDFYCVWDYESHTFTINEAMWWDYIDFITTIGDQLLSNEYSSVPM